MAELGNVFLLEHIEPQHWASDSQKKVENEYWVDN
jgi:hypothetical protein